MEPPGEERPANNNKDADNKFETLKYQLLGPSLTKAGQDAVDQRKVNMLAREYCDTIKRKLKPVIISHGMLPGLQEVKPAS